MNITKFIALLILASNLYSCGSVNKSVSTTDNNKREVYSGDTLYLIKPRAIVRRHFGEGASDFTIDSVENENAGIELANGIKKLTKKKLRVIDLPCDKIQLQEFYQKMDPLLANNNDSVYLNFKFSGSFDLSSLVKVKKKAVIISYLEWDYDTEDLYQKLYAEYSWQSGRSSSHLVFTQAITTMKLHFIVADPLVTETLTWRFKKFYEVKIKKPTFSNMRPALPDVMHPFLSSLHKKS